MYRFKINLISERDGEVSVGLQINKLMARQHRRRIHLPFFTSSSSCFRLLICSSRRQSIAGSHLPVAIR